MKKIILSCLVHVYVMQFALAQLPSEFINYNSTKTPTFTTNNFKAIGIGKNGYIWAGTQYGGLYRYSPVTFLWDKSTDITNVFINDIKTDKAGGIWIAQSGTSGTTGGGSNIAGGFNYYPDEFFSSMQFYSVTPGGGLSSRNARSIWIDTNRYNGASRPRVWGTQGLFITSSNSAAGGIALGLNGTTDYFTKITNGLQVVPYVNSFNAGSPSCWGVGGNKNEVWVFAQANFGRGQILRYKPGYSSGSFIGAYDNTNVPQMSAASRGTTIYFDADGRQWMGLISGGIIVKDGTVWKNVNMPGLFEGTSINNNAITGDDEGNIYIGTSNGLIVYTGGAVDAAGSYEKYTVNDGLPSNNINGVAVDTAGGRILIATDNGVSFWQRKKNVNIKLAWDYSFPTLDVKPRGVAADGVSRLYVKVKRAEGKPKIKLAEISMFEFSADNATVRGRLKKALVTDKYSTEATTGTLTETSRPDSNSKGEFVFWYVAPEDFSASSTGPFANVPERKDYVKVRVTYIDDTKDSEYLAVRVVRPPLVLVHGLASGPSTWDSCKHSGYTYFVSSDMFKYKRALTLNGRGAFAENAEKLVSGDVITGADKLNTLQGNIEELRRIGYAANQVDYLCHSMGGIMIRGAIGWQADKFYANSEQYMYNNYGKGFVHKLIFINTPHNSSPIADGVQEFVPKFNEFINKGITLLFKKLPAMQEPFDFIQPKNTTDLIFIFQASDAVRDLQITDALGGKNLPATSGIKNHLITGDVNITSSVVDDLVQYKNLAKLVNGLLRVARDYYPSPAKELLTSYFDNNKNEIDRMLFFFNWYSGTKNFPGFTADGDLIVPYASETARQPETQSNITKFLNSPGSVYDASHVTIIPRKDVGQKVFDLLNDKINNNPLFGDFIPGNNDPEPDPSPSLRPATGAKPLVVTVTTAYDTSKIVIGAPGRTGGATYADSTLLIKYRLKDTVGLAYTNIRFQDIDSFRNSRVSSQQLSLKTSPVFTGNQLVYAVAVYDKQDGVKYYVDTLSITVGNLATLQGFRIQQEAAELTEGQPYYPAPEIKYSNNWVPLGIDDSDIIVTLSPEGIIKYDTASHAFTALQDGFTQAYFQYKGYRDTISFTSILPLSSICINKTITGGSFKNPAIWSRGTVPGLCDSVVIQSGHAVIMDTTLQVKALRISFGGTLTVNDTLKTLRIGGTDNGNRILDNYGVLTISNGTVQIGGSIKLNTASSFNMSGGLLAIDGNTGFEETSPANGTYLFEAAPAMQLFSFTAGTLQIADPPFGAASQAISCNYDFGNNSTLVLGINTSTTVSKNPDGFGSTNFPNKIGKLVINAGTKNGNRQFINKKALTVKGNVEVKTGSAIILAAPLNVTQ